MKCFICSIAFTIREKRYLNYCSQRCFLRKWRRDNPERNKELDKRAAKKYSQKSRKKSCMICGFNRAIDKAHIIPKSKGGRKCIWLCPNHHRLFDRDKLSVEEHETLKEFLL